MRKRILVVEDEPAILNLVCMSLQQRGLDVVPCADTASALEYISTARFDAAVFDIRMPGSGGIELLRRYRDRQPSAPAFVMSGNITAATLETIDALGARSFDKPLDMDRFCEAVASGARASTQAHPWSILVADDEPAILSLLTTVLAAEGYRVTTASDGAEAVRAMRAAIRPFDIALVDINMPHLNGVSLIREMDGLCPETLPVIMTGEGTREQIQEAYLRGGATMIRKPFSLDVLKRFIESLDEMIADRRSQAARRRAAGARSAVERAADGLKRVWSSPPGTRARELRNSVLVGATLVAVAAVGLRVADSIEAATDRRIRQIEDRFTRVKPLPEAPRQPVFFALPAVPARPAAPPSLELGPESFDALQSFLGRVEGYLERDERREIGGTDGPVLREPAGRENGEWKMDNGKWKKENAGDAAAAFRFEDSFRR